jgi:hypothetical protein
MICEFLAVSVKNTFLCGVKLYNLVDRYQNSGENCCILLQGRRLKDNMAETDEPYGKRKIFNSSKTG